MMIVVELLLDMTKPLGMYTLYYSKDCPVETEQYLIIEL